jgi:SPP1 family predicted phage head-tail adaptor
MSGGRGIGALRSRLTLETASRADDGGGGTEITWQTVAELWASVRVTGGGEGFSLDRVAGRLTHEIVLRYRGDVTSAMRFRDGPRVYDIRATFDPDGSRHWLKCLVAERDL